MLPASFAIPYLLTAHLPASLTIKIVPTADGLACPPVAQACFATVRVVARNRSNRTMLLDELSVALSARPSRFHHPFDPPLPVPPFGEVTLPDLFAFHVEAIHSENLSFHEAGEQPGRHLSGQAISGGALRAAAYAACMHCNGGRRDLCSCLTGDSGRRCTEPSQCQGVCLFDRFEASSQPTCVPRPGLRCPISLPTGFRVGHCSDLKIPSGCLAVLTQQDSAAHPIPLPAALTSRCFDDASLVER